MKARPGEIKLRWRPKTDFGSFSRDRGGDFEVAWGGQGASKADGNWVLGFLMLEKSETIKAVAELERRGYDLSTLRFSIRKKKNVHI